jgi:NitT/TauT family transport system substrate-binding protein
MRFAAAAKRALVGCAFLAMLVSSAGRAPSSAQATLTPVIVGPLNSASSAGLYYAQQQGLFAKAGLDVKIQPMPGGAAAVAATVGGAINIGYGNTLTVIEAHAKQIPISLLAPGSLYQSQNPVAQLLVSGSSAIKTPADLAGLTIAVTSLNDLAVLAIKEWLERGSVDPSKVNFIEVPPAGAMAALSANRVAAIILYDPYLGAALAQGAKVIAKPYDFIAPTFLISAWFVSTQWATEHRDAALAFAKVLEQVSPYINTHYNDLLPMISKITSVSVDNLAKLPVAIVPTSMSPQMLQPVIDAAVHFKAIPTAFKAQDIIFTGTR